MAYRHMGHGHLPGIPARDLSDEDVQALTDEQRADVATNAALDHGAVYEEIKAKAAAPAAPANEEEQS